MGDGANFFLSGFGNKRDAVIYEWREITARKSNREIDTSS